MTHLYDTSMFTGVCLHERVEVWVVCLLPWPLEDLSPPGSPSGQQVLPCHQDPEDLDHPREGGKNNTHLTDI